MIGKQSTMKEVLSHYPSAQRALFVRYHVGGCSSCGFQMEDTLEQVCLNHNNLDVNEVISHIQQSADADGKLEIEPREVAEYLKKGELKLLDVRGPDEYELAHIEGAQLVDEQLSQELHTWPKDTFIVLHCHHGQRSLDAASYLIGHGFSNVKSMRGGIEAWSNDVDPAVPRY